jgi:hypothetical protein
MNKNYFCRACFLIGTKEELSKKYLFDKDRTSHCLYGDVVIFNSEEELKKLKEYRLISVTI